jgi:molybdopterin molybdotransferase
MTVDPLASCCDDNDPHLLAVEEARRRIDAALTPLQGSERVALKNALDRILATEVRSPIDVPSRTNSAMDGYAMLGRDLPGQGTRVLRVVGTSMAGAPFAQAVTAGECVRIMTGAVMPEGTDTVLIQERVRREGDVIRFGAGDRLGQNVRRAGEDIPAGSVVLHKGRRLRAAELGLLGSLGMAEVDVLRRVRVAYFSTGNEVCSVGERPRPGDVFDSNRYALHGMLSRAGAAIVDLGVVRDDRDSLRLALHEAAHCADVVITSGGVSTGDADYVREILAELGEVSFWRLAMKPGRPLAFGRIGGAALFGLPGNPVAVMVTFCQFVLPALARLTGCAALCGPTQRLPVAEAISKSPGRTEFRRGVAAPAADGRLVVSPIRYQGSGRLTSMGAANCLILLAAESGDVACGDAVEVQLLDGIV